jgi:Uma2 family endonuclease
MKGVMLRVPEELLAHRRRTGEDRWDEMWNGVLHMTPAPSFEHQRMVDELVAFLLPLVKRTGRGLLRSGVNVCDAPTGWENYRVPDLTFVAAGHEHVVAPDGVRFGGPDVVIEVRSPDDESYEKLPFFAALGVRDVVVIDRDTKRVEVFALAGQDYRQTSGDDEGWVMSEALGVRFRTATDGPRLQVQDLAESGVSVEI